MKKILISIAILAALALCSCTYNSYTITGNGNDVKGTISTEKDVKADVGASTAVGPASTSGAASGAVK